MGFLEFSFGILNIKVYVLRDNVWNLKELDKVCFNRVLYCGFVV